MYGQDEWKVKKHGADKRPIWRKLHLATDEATNDIHTVELTTKVVSDREMVKTLLAAIEQSIAKLGGDGAYDQVKVYDQWPRDHMQLLIPPRVNAVIWTHETIIMIQAVGLAEWKRQSGYHRRSKAEMVMFRWKMSFGERLSTRLLKNQQTEIQVKANWLNRFTKLGMPKAVKQQLT
nr:IS5 family transposase [Siphonobacter curvatus]